MRAVVNESSLGIVQVFNGCCHKRFRLERFIVAWGLMMQAAVNSSSLTSLIGWIY